MLIRFVVSNYLSFGAETEFNMLTGSPRRLREHIYAFDDVELLKVAAVYGPNGAGKSNLVKAVSLLQRIVTTGKWDAVADIQPFRLDPAFSEQPTHLEAEFVKNDAGYNYGISILRNAVAEEWLYRTHPGKEDELIFNRTTSSGETSIEISDRYYRTEEDKLRIKLYEQELLRDDQPFIKLLAEAKQVLPEVEAVFTWFRENLSVIFPSARPVGLVAKLHFSAPFRSFAKELLRSLQTGVTGLDLQTMDIDQFFGEDDKDKADQIRNLFRNKKESVLNIASRYNDHIVIRENDKLVVKRLVTKHANPQGDSFDFTVGEESDGTRRILDFIPAFYGAINHPKTILIDEIDQSIHPYLLKELVAKFVADTSTKGQLIFTTHESHLLDQEIFRQDEIWFAEKKPTGETTLYPLSDFDIRYDLDIRKGYLNGRFSAIPFLANLRDLNWDVYAEAEQVV